ncbi:hypothetical protein JCM10213_001462 [Rhodosporidiobolus nylandii]
MPRTTRSSRATQWTIVPSVSALKARNHNQRHINFLCTSPSNPPLTFSLSVRVDPILDERRPAGQAAQGGYAEKAHRVLQGEYQDIAETVAASLKKEDGEAQVRQKLFEAGIPIPLLGASSHALALPALSLATQRDTPNGPSYKTLRLSWRGGVNTQDDFGESSINVLDSVICHELHERFDLACAQAEESDARNYDTWVSTIEKISDPYQLAQAKVLLVTVVEAFSDCAESMASTPTDLQVRSRFQQLLTGGWDGHPSADWFCRFRKIEPEDPANASLAPPHGRYLRCDLTRCDRSRGNQETSIIVSLRAYEEDGGDEGDYDEAVEEFIDAVLDMVIDWSAEQDPRSFEDAVDLINGIKPAPKPRLGGSVPNPTLRSPAEWAIRRTLFNSCGASRSTLADINSLDREEAVSIVFQRCVKLEKGKHVVRSDYTPAIIAEFDTTPMSAAEYNQYLKEYHGGRSNVSLDHEHQVTVRAVKKEDGSVEYVTAFSSGHNFRLCSVAENYLKHRYPPVIFGLLLLFFAFEEAHPNWQHSPDAPQHAVVLAFLAAAIKILYRTWEVPCPRFERLRMAIFILFAGRREQEHAAAMWGVQFSTKTTAILDAMGNPENIDDVLHQSEENFRAALAKILAMSCAWASVDVGDSEKTEEASDGPDPLDDPLTMACIERLKDEGLVSSKRVKQALTAVRSAGAEDYPRPAGQAEKDEKAVLEAGKQVVEDMAHYGVGFVLTQDGIPSLNLLGTETVNEICASLHGMKHYTAIPIPELYMHLVCSKIHQVVGDKLGKEYKFTEEVQPIQFIVYLTAFSLGCMPFDSPFINKSSLGLSASHLNHDSARYLTGFKPGVKLVYANFDWSRVTFVVDTWGINSAVRGTRGRQIQTLKTLCKTSLDWCKTGAGVKAAETFGIISGRLSLDQQLFLLNSFYGIVNRHEYLGEDPKITQTLEALAKSCDAGVSGEESEMDWEGAMEEDEEEA